MIEEIVLPPGVAIAILAFLLSLLPAALFIWLWYLRRHDRHVPARLVFLGFMIGLFLVLPAYLLERFVPSIWLVISPATAHYFSGSLLPIQSISDLILTAIGAFLVVSFIEEGLRYLVLWGWFRWSKRVNQVFDGLLIGLAAGLGFATLENTLYFFELFSSGKFNTLVFVFFLRFVVSTLAHISFGGIMGVLITRGVFAIYRPGIYYAQAFLIPWFLHGAFDWLLGINQTIYAVLILLVPLILLFIWSNKREFFIIARSATGELLLAQEPPDRQNISSSKKNIQSENPWNREAPWMLRKRRVSSK